MIWEKRLNTEYTECIDTKVNLFGVFSDFRCLIKFNDKIGRNKL